MNESVAVAHADTEKNSPTAKRATLFPKEDWPILATLALPCLAGLVVLNLLPSWGTLYVIPSVNISITLSVVVFVALFVAAFILGSLVQSRKVTFPVRTITDWLRVGRTSHFASLTMTPEFGKDAIGDLGREIAASISVFSTTSMHNDALMKQKSELLMIAAHQLHTPMTEVHWGIEQLMDPKTAPETKDELAKSIALSLKRMSFVIDNIVVSSDIDTDAARYVFEPVDLVPMIDGLLLEFKPFAAERKVELSFVHASVAPVRADSYRLSSVFFNLLSNALDYTPAGGKVTVTIEQKAQGVECNLADTGIGIPEREIPLLFSKFHRGEHAKHMRPDGSGLGLYLVKNIIGRHGSDVVVRSKDGAGTTVSFTLPVA